MVGATQTGQITQVIGSTFDAEFGEGSLPEIYNALTVDEMVKGTHVKVTGEVQQHLGGGPSSLRRSRYDRRHDPRYDRYRYRCSRQRAGRKGDARSSL